MRRDILYFINLKSGCKFVYPHKKIVYKDKYLKILNDICLSYVCTIDGRIKAMSKLWGSNYNVPIYINQDVCFLKVERNLWINILNVEKVTEKVVVFKCGKMINFEVPKRKIREKMDKISEIIKNVKK